MSCLSACSLKLCAGCEQAFAEITARIVITLAPLPNVMMQDTHNQPKIHLGGSTIAPFPRCKRNGHGWSMRDYVTTERPVNCKRCLTVPELPALLYWKIQ